MYRSPGIYTITLTVNYAAEYRYAGGGWTGIAGTLGVPANELTAEAGDVKTVLVAADCCGKPLGARLLTPSRVPEGGGRSGGVSASDAPRAEFLAVDHRKVRACGDAANGGDASNAETPATTKGPRALQLPTPP